MVVGVRISRKQQPRQLLDARFCETLRSIRRALLPFPVLAEVLLAGCGARQCFGEEALGACRREEEEQGAPHFDATRRRRDAVLLDARVLVQAWASEPSVASRIDAQQKKL